ncbi:MAG: hypothetical protein ACOX18_08955 [Bacillota bacterium]|jgi:hypothetical protein
MMCGPVIYAQGLAGSRWAEYAYWTRFLSDELLERVGRKLPPKTLWSGGVTCGEHEVGLETVAGPADSSVTGWVTDLADRKPQYLVPSLSLPDGGPRRGRLLSTALVVELLGQLKSELRVFGDRLSVGLAVAPAEERLWQAALEPVVRSLTVLRSRVFHSLPLGASGLAVRQLPYASGRLDAHVLIVSGENLRFIESLALRRGTLIILTNGAPYDCLPGCASVSFALDEILPLPERLLAAEEDRLPLLEAVMFCAYAQRWRASDTVLVARQVVAAREAWEWSGWRYRWEYHQAADAGHGSG